MNLFLLIIYQIFRSDLLRESCVANTEFRRYRIFPNKMRFIAQSKGFDPLSSQKLVDRYHQNWH